MRASHRLELILDAVAADLNPDQADAVIANAERRIQENRRRNGLKETFSVERIAKLLGELNYVLSFSPTEKWSGADMYESVDAYVGVMMTDGRVLGFKVQIKSGTGGERSFLKRFASEETEARNHLTKKALILLNAIKSDEEIIVSFAEQLQRIVECHSRSLRVDWDYGWDRRRD